MLIVVLVVIFSASDDRGSKLVLEIGIMDGFGVECRIRDGDGYRGTVRYIGPVAAAKNQTENWLGVEWDKQDRGKHDGSCTDKVGKLHRYFDCVDGAGSFVRPSKKNPINSGRTFETALRERYVRTNAPKIKNEAMIIAHAVHTAGIVLPTVSTMVDARLTRYNKRSEIRARAGRNHGYKR